MMKHIKELFKKQAKEKPTIDPIATIVITMNTETGDMKVVGNVLKDPKLCMMMLIEAGHKLINNPISPTEQDSARVESPSPLITH